MIPRRRATSISSTAKRDRDAAAPLDHRIEERVARVAVVLGVTAEPFDAEQQLAHVVEGRRAAAMRSHRRVLAMSSMRRHHASTSTPERTLAEMHNAASSSRMSCLGTVHDLGEAVGRIHRERPYSAGTLADPCVARATTAQVAASCARRSCDGSAGSNNA